MTKLMFVSALLLLLVTAVADAGQGSGCSYMGRSLDDGTLFLGLNRCTKLQCYNGRIRSISKRCAYKGLCYTVGSNIRAGSNGCKLYRCQRNEQFTAVEGDPFGCADAFNRCKICDA
ncbi:uncharacterized protein [Haliotis asinina]|uniref:uncharacterized protein n=1 Tax=Haliotis asinina TaxID=109174 RepID=UPI003531D8D0